MDAAPPLFDPLRKNRLAAGLFFAALALSSLAALFTYPFPYQELDEHGHASYVAWLAESGRFWPDFDRMPIYDAAGAATATPNFINHPPTFYALALPAYEATRAIGADPATIRWFGFGLSLAAFGALTLLGARARFGAAGFVGVFIAMTLLKVPSYAALFNNDQMALLGGALAVLGAYRRLERRGDRLALALLLVGVALASVKLTALLLVGLFAVGALLGSPLDRRGLVALALAGLAASAPFVALWAIDGAPAPATLGQTLMLREAAASHGWDAGARLGPLAYLVRAPAMFAQEIAPGLEGLVALAVLALAPLAAFAGRATGDKRAAIIVARAATVATLLTLAVHLGFAYRRHLDFGWLGDLYPRYYFPLLGAYAVGWMIAARRVAGLPAGLRARFDAGRA